MRHGDGTDAHVGAIDSVSSSTTGRSKNAKAKEDQPTSSVDATKKNNGLRCDGCNRPNHQTSTRRAHGMVVLWRELFESGITHNQT